MNKYYSTITLFCFPILLIAQTFQVGGSLGFSNYQGDVASDKIWSPEEFNFGVNAFVKYNFHPKWSLRANTFFTKLSGDDTRFSEDHPWRTRRDYSFESSIREIAIIVEWRFLDNHIRSQGFHPYLFAGKGFVSATVDETTFSSTDNPKTSESSGLYSVVPLGAGFYFDLNNRVTLGMEISSRIPFSDNLDGLSPQGFSEGNDWYNNASITLAYEFGADSEVEKRRKKF